MRKHILFDLDGTLTDPVTGITSSVRYGDICFIRSTKEIQKQ